MPRAFPFRTTAHSLVLLLALTAACGSFAMPASAPMAPVETSSAPAELSRAESAPTLVLSEPTAPDARVSLTAPATPEVTAGSDALQGATAMPDVAASFGMLSAYVGYRSMTSELWEPLEDQLVLGLDYTLRGPDSWLGMEFGFLSSYSSDDSSLGDLDTYSFELYLGPRIVFDVPKSPFQVYAAAGPSFLYYNLEAENASNTRRYRTDDYTFGIYAHLGVLLRLNQRQFVGIEYRALRGTEVQLAAFDDDADYNQLSLVFSSYL